MRLFSVVEEPYAVVGQGTMALLRGAGGTVGLRGDDAAVHAALKALTHVELPSEAAAAPVWIRVIAVDSAGHHYALAFTLAPGTEIGLQEIEQIENFCSGKIGSAVIVLRWDVVAPPKATQIIAQEPVAAAPGEDVVGGVKCVPQEDVETELVDVPEARPESKAVRPSPVRS